MKSFRKTQRSKSSVGRSLEPLESRHMMFGFSFIDAAPLDIVAETGVVEVSQTNRDDWDFIKLNHRFKDPVVIAQAQTQNGSEPFTIRVKDVAQAAFKVQIDEWNYLDGKHQAEQIAYMVVESGTHVLDDGTVLQAGDVSANHTWTDVRFDSRFDNPPIVVSHTLTDTGSEAVTTRHTDLSADGMKIKLQEEEGSYGWHSHETVGFVAISATSNSSPNSISSALAGDVSSDATRFDHNFHESPSVFAAMQTFNGRDTATTSVSNVTASGSTLKIREEHAFDAESNHASETVGAITVGRDSVIKAKTFPRTILREERLEIKASSAGGTVTLYEFDQSFAVSSWDGAAAQNVEWFTTDDVTSIVFRGSEYYDLFSNGTTIPSTIFGNGGHDYLSGGFGRDFIFGGLGNDVILGNDGNDFLFGDSGNDTLSGENGHDYLFGAFGNDRLYGDSGSDFLVGEHGIDTLNGGLGNDTLFGGYAEFGIGRLYGLGPHVRGRLHASNQAASLYPADGDDTLFGGSGSDWLYGGRGRNTVDGGWQDDAILSLHADGESLSGGWGKDRFLLHERTSADIEDRESVDAQIRFYDSSGNSRGYGPASWTVSDIHAVDNVFDGMAEVAGSTKILEKANGRTVKFVRRGERIDPDQKFIAWNGGGTITLTNFNFASDQTLTRDVAHELAHNWDNENPEWQAFRALSGWTNSDPDSPHYVKSLDGKWWYLRARENDFARDYGKTNPLEDFATTFEAYFLDELGHTQPDGPRNSEVKNDFMTSFAQGLADKPRISRLVIA